MKKTLLTLAAFALTLTGVRASVAINSTNFPDENFLWEVEHNWDIDQDGVLSDEEIAERDFVWLSGVTNFKGIEYFYHITQLLIGGLNSDGQPVRNLDLTKFTKLERLEIGEYPDITSLDFTNSPNLTSLYISTMAGLTTVQIPASIADLHMYWNPKLTTVNLDACRENLGELHVQDVGIKDIDVSNFKKLHRIYIEGNDAENIYKLNSLNIAGCDELWSISIQYTDIESVTIKDLPAFMEATVSYNDIRKLTVENCPELLFLDCQDNKLPELHIKKCDKFWRIFASNNYMRTLIIDESPLEEVEAAGNLLMWLDLSKVVFEKDRLNDAQAPIKVNNQTPAVQAVKISPTETGLLVHERFDVSRVLNLRAKGLSQTPRETTVDGIRYFVFYDNGPDTPNLVGSDCFYEYDTKWPYPWIEGNSKDNNLPVTLKVTSWTKHQAFLTLSESTVRGKYSEPAPAAPTVTRSQDYDGKITFSSSNENVVKVDPNTGELTVVGAGTAIIYVKGEETDYRLAPVTKTYTVIIEKASPVFAFAQATVEAEVGKAVPENKLAIQMYDGTVQYTSSNEEIATVDENGVVTAKTVGEVTITAIGPATSNCNEAQQASYTLTVKEEGAGISAIDNGQLIIDNYYDLQGRRVKANAARKGVYVIGKKKVMKK